MHFIILAALFMLLSQTQPKYPAKITAANDRIRDSNVGIHTPNTLCTHHTTDAAFKSFYLLCSQGAIFNRTLLPVPLNVRVDVMFGEGTTSCSSLYPETFFTYSRRLAIGLHLIHLDVLLSFKFQN